MIRIAVLCAIVCYPVAAWGQTSSAASVVQGSSAQGMSRSIDYGMPEHLRRQVAPTPSTFWSAPDLRGYKSLLKTAEPSPIDQQKRHNLVELIDIAERVNPETRVAWEAARKAAIAVGLVESEYFPVLTLSAIGGYRSEALPAPKDLAPTGFFRATLNQAVPQIKSLFTKLVNLRVLDTRSLAESSIHQRVTIGIHIAQSKSRISRN